MQNKNKAVWNTRFNKTTSKIFEKIGASIDIDKRLFEEDILGSSIHVQMLIKQKIINRKKGIKIINGLKRIRSEIKRNKFKFNKKYEDIHLNIEKRLFEIIGSDAGYLHIARSRNDQVITDFKLWIKKSSNISEEIGFGISLIAILLSGTSSFVCAIDEKILKQNIRIKNFVIF